MRITYLYDGRYPSTGADAWQVLNTATALSRQGADVTLAFPKNNHRKLFDPEELLKHYDLHGSLKLVQLSTRHFGLRPLEKFTHPAICLKDPSIRDADLIYTRNIPSILMALRAQKHVVYDTYRPWPSQFRTMKTLFRKIFNQDKMLGAFFHSLHTLRAFADAGIAESKLLVAHNGFNPNFYLKPMRPSDARTEIGIPPDTFTIGYTGRLAKEKGIGALLDIVEGMPDVNCLLVGGGAEDDVVARIASLSNAYLHEWQAPGRVPTFLHACDLLMLPPSATALNAGNTVLPMKLFGYFASGRTIVAPRSPDTAELLRHNENAWLLPQDTVEESIKHVRRLQSDDLTRKRLAQTALAESKHMTWDARGQKLLRQIEAWMSPQ